MEKNPDVRFFYHGSATKDFTLDDLDITKEENGKKKNRKYAKLYLFGEEDRLDAIKNTVQENYIKDTDKGVVKITMQGDLKIFEKTPFTISSITKEELESLQKQGYDLVCGKMFKTEYLLLNKNKVIDLSFFPIDAEKVMEEEKNTYGDVPEEPSPMTM